jgi:hypothetical protein
MESVSILVEGITDKSFLERLPGLQREQLDFSKAYGGGQERGKADFAGQMRAGVKAILCLDIDDKSPEAKFTEVKESLDKQSIPILSVDSATGTLSTEGGEVLFVPLGLWEDEDLASLHITRHFFEDYLIKIALEDPMLKSPYIPHTARESLGQAIAEYANKGCRTLSSAQVYQLAKPFVGLPKHETSAISRLLSQANEDIVRETTRPLVETLNSFLADTGGPE